MRSMHGAVCSHKAVGGVTRQLTEEPGHSMYSGILLQNFNLFAFRGVPCIHRVPTSLPETERSGASMHVGYSMQDIVGEASSNAGKGN